MPRRLTTAEFIIKAEAVHQSQYDYSEVVYEASNQHVCISCRKCGKTFLQRPNGHLAGAGCPDCLRVQAGLSRRGNNDEFIQRAIAVHGDEYIYDLVEYKTAREKVKIVCRMHGEFHCSPDKHLQGKGCSKCGDIRNAARFRSNTDEFVARATAIHGDKYCYDKSKYGASSLEKLTVTCKVHGDFKCSPSNHLRGKGCPSCKKCGYRPSNTGTIYVLASDSYVKVGITNRSAHARCRDIARNSGIGFTVAASITCANGAIPPIAEKQVLAHLRESYKNPQNRFDGSTECFHEVDVEHVILRVKEVINNITQKCGQ